jgi:hypothetical protein
MGYRVGTGGLKNEASGWMNEPAGHNRGKQEWAIGEL